MFSNLLKATQLVVVTVSVVVTVIVAIDSDDEGNSYYMC